MVKVDNVSTFSYHENSGWSDLLMVFMALILVEAVAGHVILFPRHKIFSILHSVLSGYAMSWFLGDYEAIKRYPILVNEKIIKIRIGFRWSLVLPIEEISQIDLGEPLESQASPQKVCENEYKNLSVCGSPELTIQLKHPLIACGLFGIERKITQVGISPDNFLAFKERVEILMRSGIENLPDTRN